MKNRINSDPNAKVSSSVIFNLAIDYVSPKDRVAYFTTEHESNTLYCAAVPSEHEPNTFILHEGSADDFIVPDSPFTNEILWIVKEDIEEIGLLKGIYRNL